MDFQRKARLGAKIPTASTADIAFLLNMFFMVTTIFKLEEGLAITMPRSRAGEKVPKEKVVHIWIDQAGTISIDDLIVTMGDIEPILIRKMDENPMLIIAFNADEKTPYKIMNDAMERLKLAQALRVSFTTIPEES
ncbi:MAG: biopolymer transporter ExbD [Candidatus Eisenbacteria bacterium]|nr:biopolymer transporter ExbD [Candidatus Eisenbacteria bacterium]